MSLPITSTSPNIQQRQAIDRAGLSHGTLENAQRHLFRALGRPVPNRERDWATRVAAELHIARDAIARHREEVEGAGGLYDELCFEAPWLLSRIEQLIAQMRRLETQAGDLATEVERVRQGDLQPLPTIRLEAERTLLSLRELLAKEADLVWERFNEPVAQD